MAWLSRRSNKPGWYIIYKVKSANGWGTRRKATGTEDRTEAELQLAYFVKQQQFASLAAELGHALPASPIHAESVKVDPFEQHRKRPISEHAEEWASSRRGRMSEKQVVESLSRVNWIISKGKIKTLEDWTLDRVEAVCSDLKKRTSAKQQNPKKSVPATMRTRNSYRQSAMTFDSWLVARGRLATPSLSAMTKEKNKRYQPTRIRTPLSIDEANQLLKSVYHAKAVVQGYGGRNRHLLYLLAPVTGLRRSELGALVPDWFRLDTEIPHVKVPGTVTKNGRDGDRPLPSYTIPYLTATLNEKPRDQPLFPKLGGDNGRDTAAMMRVDLAEAGLAYRVGNVVHDFHQWRHLFATETDRQARKLAEEITKGMTRHSDYRTAQGYCHQQLEIEFEVINRHPKLWLPDQEQ